MKILVDEIKMTVQIKLQDGSIKEYSTIYRDTGNSLYIGDPTYRTHCGERKPGCDHIKCAIYAHELCCGYGGGTAGFFSIILIIIAILVIQLIVAMMPYGTGWLLVGVILLAFFITAACVLYYLKNAEGAFDNYCQHKVAELEEFERYGTVNSLPGTLIGHHLLDHGKHSDLIAGFLPKDADTIETTFSRTGPS